PGGRNGSHHGQRIEWFGRIERRPARPHQGIYGNVLRMGIKNREFVEQSNPVLGSLAHSQDSSRANRNPRPSNVTDGLATFFISAGGNDLSVELGRTIEIVVVGGEA